MRRLILYFFAALLVGVALALVFRDHNGYVLVAFGDWRLETSLLFAVGVLVFGLWLLVGIWRLLVAGVLLPRSLGGWLARRRARKARHSLDDGLLRLLEGRWAQAETELVRLAEGNTAPQINYLAAARAAQMQGASGRRDNYLEKAAAQKDASELAIVLTQAELQMWHDQNAEALASLSRLRELDADHPYVLRLYVDVCERLGDFAQLRELLPALRKANVVPRARWLALAVAAHGDALRNAAGVDKLQALWKQVPKRLRGELGLARVYCQCLHAAGGDEPAADAIRSALKDQWDPWLALLFGELKLEDRTGQLATVETWLKQYGDEPELLLVAGRLCLRNRLWGRARSYFESSVRGQSRPDALLELGRLFEEVEQGQDACRAYKQGLERAVADDAAAPAHDVAGKPKPLTAMQTRAGN